MIVDCRVAHQIRAAFMRGVPAAAEAAGWRLTVRVLWNSVRDSVGMLPFKGDLKEESTLQYEPAGR